MSEEDRLDIVAAILASNIGFGTSSLQRRAAASVVAYRRIKHMLARHGTAPLGAYQGGAHLHTLLNELTEYEEDADR